MIPERLLRQLGHMDELIAQGERLLSVTRTEISGWSVAQHLDHLLKVGNRVMNLLLAGVTVEGAGINLLGKAVLFTGFIPRGKGESPEAVLGEKRTAEELREALAKFRRRTEEFLARGTETSSGGRPPSLIMPHPFFGNLTAPQSIRFLTVHNHHHFKIIRDILKAEKARDSRES